jgi:plastocyanin
MNKLTSVRKTVVRGIPRDRYVDRPMDQRHSSQITDLPATLRMLRMARALKAALRRPVRSAAPLRLLVAAPALAVVVGACSGAYGAGAPAYTYAPPSSPSASSSMSMSPSASEAAVSTAPIPTGSPDAAGAPLHIAAQNIQFDTDHLEASAGEAFVLEFDNNDPGVPHNIEIRDASGASMFKGQIITGPVKASYRVPALAAGTYIFLCDVHPTMTGTVTVH